MRSPRSPASRWLRPIAVSMAATSSGDVDQSQWPRRQSSSRTEPCGCRADPPLSRSEGLGVKSVVEWGTGTPRREFLYVDDMADACVHLMKIHFGGELIDVSTGEEMTIAQFARLVADVVGYSGEITFDTSRPDGTPRKLLD